MMEEKIKYFFKRISEIDIHRAEIPEIRIPDWPNNLKIVVHLVPYHFPRFLRGKYITHPIITDSDTLSIIRNRGEIRFTITTEGVFQFYIKMWMRFYECTSYHVDAKTRAQAIILFKHYFEDIYRMVIDKIERDEPNNNYAVQKAKEAFEPFIPYFIADELSGR